MHILVLLKFTPLEFETQDLRKSWNSLLKLKFTPLEFETKLRKISHRVTAQLKFTPLEFETLTPRLRRILPLVKIYSVGV